MDISTFIGIVAGFVLVVIAILLDGSPNSFINPPSLLIVFGGAIATTFIRFRLSQVFGTFSVLKNAFFTKLGTNEALL